MEIMIIVLFFIRQQGMPDMRCDISALPGFVSTVHPRPEADTNNTLTRCKKITKTRENCL